ncbi:hypothetical protein DFH94DRAFT_682643 [Russula ochroleuca]|uniref:Uncharacterized protein n=1 Tax=Russula ochroleuca TaxID=152965 RepID=A0A9P5T8N2_9AGAM|nr:hypothetical protein DFH94DRAFT_682643 [Russula ochroleuca]
MPAGAKWAWLGEDVVRVARNDGCFGERLRLPPRWAKSYLLVASQFPSTLANQLDGGDQGADMAVEVVEAPVTWKEENLTPSDPIRVGCGARPGQDWAVKFPSSVERDPVKRTPNNAVTTLRANMGRSRLFYRNLFAKLVREAQIFAISADVQSAITGFNSQSPVGHPPEFKLSASSAKTSTSGVEWWSGQVIGRYPERGVEESLQESSDERLSASRCGARHPGCTGLFKAQA